MFTGVLGHADCVIDAAALRQKRPHPKADTISVADETQMPQKDHQVFAFIFVLVQGVLDILAIARILASVIGQFWTP